MERRLVFKEKHDLNMDTRQGEAGSRMGEFVIVRRKNKWGKEGKISKVV